MKYIPVGYFNNIAFGPETELNLVIDSTANLADTKILLDTLVNADLKDLLLPFYGTEAKYQEKVRVIENDTEQPYSMLTTFNLSSKNSFVFAFIDEATPYGDIYTTENSTVISDINTLVNKVSGYKKEYKGFIFRVKDNGDVTFGESQKLREIINAVHNKHIPYTNTSYNQIQLPVVRENQLFNRLDIADDDELTRFEDLDSTEMETNSRYKYYGYEIIDALNKSVVSLNIENDVSFLMSNINSSITYTIKDAFDMEFPYLKSKIEYLIKDAFNMKFDNLKSSIVYINKTGEISEYTRLQSLLGPGNPFYNRGGYLNIPAINLDIKAIQSKISFTSLGGVGQ